MEYTKLEGLTIVSDPTAQKWEINCGPGETNIIILEAGFEGTSFGGRGGA